MRIDHGWDMPAEWRDGFFPRHGGLPVPPPQADPGAPEALLKLLGESDLAAAANGDYDPAPLDEARRFAADLARPDAELSARGAGAAGLFVADFAADARYDHPTPLPALAEAWIVRGGVVFAARAVAEMAGLMFHPLRRDAALCRRPIRTVLGEEWRDDDPEVVRQEDEEAAVLITARVVRAHLAAADDADHAEAARVLAAYRDGPLPQRVVVSFVLPGRADWVDEDIAALPSWFERFPIQMDGRLHLLPPFSATSTGQLERYAEAIDRLEVKLHWLNTWWVLERMGPGAVFATVFDGVGTEAVRVLTDNPGWRSAAGLGSPWSRQMSTDGLARLTHIPADEALRAVVAALLPRRYSDLHKTGALSRDPVRAVRVLTEPDAPAAAPDLAAMLVLTDPALRDRLPEADRARVDAYIGDGTVVGGRLANDLDEHDQDRWNLFDTIHDRRQVINWLSAIPTDAAFGLLAARADRPGIRPVVIKLAARDPGRALRVLAALAPERPEARDVVAELLRDHVLTYPPAATEALPAPARTRVEAILAAQIPAGLIAPEEALPMALRDAGKTKTLPVWIVPATLPPIRLRDGGAVLPEQAVRRLLALLTRSTFGAPDPGLAEVRDTCDPDSLAACALTLFGQWQRAEHPASDKQALIALGLLGDDSVVPPLTDAVIAWTEDAIARAKTALEVFTALGTDAAITGLLRMSRTTKQKGFRKQAEGTLADIARARGLTPTELADRIVPDLGLDTDGRMTLDYGPRQFTVTFDIKLNPIILDTDGHRLRGLPRAAATDNSELAEQAKTTFTALKKAARALAVERGRALEDAMVTSRTWPVPDLRRFILDHPAVRHLARALLWQADNGPAFRIAEDGTLADLNDKTITLTDDQHVGLYHPATGSTDHKTWAEIFTDYEIFQPFHQLDREVHRPTPQQATTRVIPLLTGRYFEPDRLQPLAARGWRFNSNGGVEHDWPGGFTTQIRLEDITVLRPEGATFGDLDPIAASETLREAQRLAAEA